MAAQLALQGATPSPLRAGYWFRAIVSDPAVGIFLLSQHELPVYAGVRMKTSTTAATAQLRRRLGSRVSSAEEVRFAASFDGSKLSFLPDAVVVPRDEKDVGVVLSYANRYHVPVTVRGGGTSLTGSGSPVKGGWVLDLSRWQSIQIDAEAGLAHVQCGAKVAAVHAAAEAAGWFYPPDPASKQYSTIGGNIACNAGGMHGGRYGVTRDFVLALEGFLPTGEFVRWGRPTKKFSAGFNLRDLWIGSEGMLGVVTRATLKLIPLPAARWTLLLAFKEEIAAFRAAKDLFSRRIQPAICEFLDRYSVACAEKATGKTVFAGYAGRPVMLIELAGTPNEVADEKKAVLRWAEEHALAFREARDRAEAEDLWSVRRKCSGAMFALGDSKLNEDIVVPLRSYEKFAAFLEKLRKQSKLSIPTFGHLGDGNLHVNIMYHRENRAEYLRAEKAVGLLMKAVVDLGGAISGEHGIGLAKSPFLRFQHSPAELRAMQAVKRALDPNGILNPGKMFDVFKVWEHPRLKIALPWDHK
jgi:glycolate oxidase